MAPNYIQDLCVPVSSVSTRVALRSAARGDLVVPHTRLHFRLRPGILRRWSCGVEQSADRHSICTNTLYFQESAQDLFVFTVVFCPLIFVNLIRVAPL